MKNEMELYLKDVAIEQLLHTKVGDKIQQAMSTFEKVQQHLYAFEYGRFILYRREQELVNEFVQAQHNMDKELEEKYKKLISDLEEQSKQFYVLIDNAFVPNFRATFLHSIKLAQAVGVKESEVLKTVEDIDSFFED